MCVHRARAGNGVAEFHRQGCGARVGPPRGALRVQLRARAARPRRGGRARGGGGADIRLQAEGHGLARQEANVEARRPWDAQHRSYIRQWAGGLRDAAIRRERDCAQQVLPPHEGGQPSRSVDGSSQGRAPGGRPRLVAHVRAGGAHVRPATRLHPPALALPQGSTNITTSGIFGHSNVGHVCCAPEVLQRYAAYWERLGADPTKNELKRFNDNLSPTPAPTLLAPAGSPPAVQFAAGRSPAAPAIAASPAAAPAAAEVLFSPRGSLDALEFYAALMGQAKQAVFLTAAFGLSQVHPRCTHGHPLFAGPPIRSCIALVSLAGARACTHTRPRTRTPTHPPTHSVR